MVENVSFSAAKNSFTAVIGPNGAGKTTLLRALSGILKLIKGCISLNDRDINSMSNKELARIQAVVSHYNGPEFITLEEYVLMGRLPYFRPMQIYETSADRKLAAGYLDMTGLSGIRKKNMGELSEGEKQLAVITRALVQEPEVLLLDEPTAYLDISHASMILDLVNKLVKDLGITAVAVLHDLNYAAEYADKIVMMKEGGVYTSGDPEVVLTFSNIEEVYRTTVIVNKSPVSGKPHIYNVKSVFLGKDNINK